MGIEMGAFLRCFSEVVVCFTRDFIGGVTASPRTFPGCGFFSPLAPQEARDASIALHVAAPAAIRVMAVQTKLRGEGARNRGYFDVALFLLRIEANGTARFVASSTGSCARVVTFDHLVDPGVYAILPFSLQQHLAAVPQLTINVLAESDRIAQIGWRDTVPPQLPINRLLYNFLVSDHAHVKTNRQHQPWEWSSWSRGTLRFEMVGVRSGQASEVTLDASMSQNVIIEPGPQRRVALPPRCGCIVNACSVTAHAGSYTMQYGHQTQMKGVNALARAFGLANTPGADNSPILFQPFALA